MRSRRMLATIGLLALGTGWLAAPAQSVGATCAGVPATIVGTTGDDELTGTPGDDVIAALEGNDVVDGGGGNDVVCGDAGMDRVTGGDGDDRLYGGDDGLVPAVESPPEPFGDTLVPGPGDDVVDLGANTLLDSDGGTVADSIDFSASATGVTVDLLSGTATGEGTDTLVLSPPGSAPGGVVVVVGSTHADHVLGTEGSDTMIGNGGGDRLEGRGGDDVLVNATDQYEYDPARNGTDDDVFVGGPGDDYLDSNGGADLLLGGDGKDHLRKVGGASTLDGGAGSDELEVYLGGGRHRLVGGPGHDEVSLELNGVSERVRGVLDHAARRLVVRRAGRLPVRARVVGLERVELPHDTGRWTYLGTPGDDDVVAGTAYTARGRGGDDVLRGSYDDDVLLGGPGDDRVRGRRGDDRCRGEDVRGCEQVRRPT